MTPFPNKQVVFDGLLERRRHLPRPRRPLAGAGADTPQPCSARGVRQMPSVRSIAFRLPNQARDAEIFQFSQKTPVRRRSVPLLWNCLSRQMRRTSGRLVRSPAKPDQRPRSRARPKCRSRSGVTCHRVSLATSAMRVLGSSPRISWENWGLSACRWARSLMMARRLVSSNEP